MLKVLLTMPFHDASAGYLSSLLRNYEEEIQGEGLFRALALMAHDRYAHERWLALAEIELHTQRMLEPIIERYGLISGSRRELLLEGAEEAERYWSGKTWYEAMEHIAQTFPGFCEEFVQLADMAPPSDLACCAQLIAHEVAFIDFADLELSGQGDLSCAILEYHIHRWNYSR